VVKPLQGRGSTHREARELGSLWVRSLAGSVVEVVCVSGFITPRRSPRFAIPKVVSRGFLASFGVVREGGCAFLGCESCHRRPLPSFRAVRG
jgi:hypothetical protein